MPRLLITGFDPFGGEAINPAWEAVRRLPDRIGCWQITPMQIPTVFGEASRKVLEAAQTLCPDVILCVGQAGGRKNVTPEMVGINLRHASIPDNAGSQPQDEPVVPGGPAAYFTTLPVRDMVRAMAQSGLPAAVSYSAGAFVCNDTLYAVLHHLDGSAVRAGFIHVPFLPEQAKDGVPWMTLEDIVRALTLCIETIPA